MPSLPPKKTGQTGLKGEVASLATSAKEYLSIRSEIIGIEAREAGSHFKRRLARLLLAFFGIIISYPLFLSGGIYFLGKLLTKHFPDSAITGWPGAVLLVASLHFLLGLIFLLSARKGPSTPLFEYTKSEWHKDQQWLNQHKKDGNKS